MRFLLAFFCLIITACPALADNNGQEDWKPVDASHLTLKAPVVEKNADAEAIFWEVQVDFKSREAVINHYIRIKIFTERGKESQGSVNIPYSEKDTVEGITGRTIKSDGTVSEVKNDAIFERSIVKASGLKLKAKSFALPAVEVGAIIEYRWREVRKDEYFLRLYFQRDIPIQLLKYTIKSHINLNIRRFNLGNMPFTQENDRFYSTTVTNIPAIHPEPYMPPEDQVRSWILAFYSPAGVNAASVKEIHEMYKSAMKVDDEVQRAATAALGNASTPEQKLERLFDFCRLKIRNLDDDASGVPSYARSKVKERQSASDTLKRGMGTGEDINLLFGALAMAAGFVARVAFVADRSDFFYKPVTNNLLLNLYFMRSNNIGVQVGQEWRFFDPATVYVPYGMLRWQEEGRNAMMFDPYQVFFRETPLSPPEKTLKKRTAKFRLSEDGSLEGDVRIEYTGHLAVEKKEDNDQLSPAKREQNLRDSIKEQTGTAEISDIRIENVTDPVKPFIQSYRVQVRGYAQRTGKRLFLQPAFFQKRIGPLFPARERKYPICFPYSWSELDTVEIELPTGFVLDSTEAPAPLSESDAFKYSVKINTSEDKHTLIYKRSFTFGSDGTIVFLQSSYNRIKQMFDAIFERDEHVITLRQSIMNQ